MIFKITRTVCLPLVCIVALLMISLNAPTKCYGLESIDIEIEIDVSPNTLNIQSQGEVVTVHTDIGYSRVAGATVSLNGVPINYWKSDNRGYFVAKFIMEAIKNLPLDIGEFNTLMLTGYTVDGYSFAGAQDIMVVDNIPAGGQQ